MRPNWFIAFTVEAPAWLAALTPPPPGARLFHPADLHATWAFLGPVHESAAHAAFAEAALRLEAAAFAPSLFAPHRLEPFGPPRAPSAYAVTPADGAPWLSALLAEHQADLIALATARPASSIRLHPPRPHVTLARPRRAATPSERAALGAWAAAQSLPSEPVVIGTCALYTWAADRRARLFDRRAVTPPPAERRP
jgi:2'-5' RNA ligase